MISYSKELVLALGSVLPIEHESFVDGKIVLPCLTYKMYDNRDTLIGDTLEYADITYMVKVWSDRVQDLEEYSLEVHQVMREHGFRRLNTNDIHANGVGQRIMIYEAISYKTNGGI